MEEIKMINNPTMTGILNRRSIRKYTEEPVAMCELATIMEAALQAPTGMNAQSCDIIMVTDQEVIDAMVKGSLAFMKENGRSFAEDFVPNYHAPAFAFIVGDPNNRWYQVDGGIIVENMALAAESMGLGSCIIGMIRDYMCSDAGADIMKRIGAPEGYEFVIGLTLGHPDETPEAKPRNGEKVRLLNAKE